MMKFGYSGPGGAQMHFRTSGFGAESRPRLVCLHPAPYSGAFFDRLIEACEGRIEIVAYDLPGFGGSAPLGIPPSIEAYSEAIAGCFKSVEGPFVLLGYHTGAFVALEMALREPAGLQGVILCGVPYLSAETRRERLSSLGPFEQDPPDLEILAPLWSTVVANRNPAVSFERAIRLFSEAMRAFPEHWRAFAAAFSYDADSALRRLACPTVIMPVAGSLEQATRAAGELVESAKTIDGTGLGLNPFETAADGIAGLIEQALAALSNESKKRSVRE